MNQLADVLARMLSPAECRQARESVEQLIDWRAAAENRLRMNETFFLALLIMSARHAMASFQHKQDYRDYLELMRAYFDEMNVSERCSR